MGSYYTSANSYYATHGGVPPPWNDGVNYRYSSDYCNTSPVSNTAGGFYSGYSYSSTTSYATHPKCWAGQKIPMCQSFKLLTYSTC